MLAEKNIIESNAREFYDLEDLQLNLDPITGTRTTSWGNLGYWSADLKEGESDEFTYACAGQRLAVQLGNMAKLDELASEHTVVDTGFGCGDQLIEWNQSFHVNHLYGINYSKSQTLFAQNLIVREGIEGFHLEQGDCCAAKAWGSIPNGVDRIIALDCLYHFHDKSRYFLNCQNKLALNGVLAVSDLLLQKPLSNPFYKLALRLICKLSNIPFSNLQTLEAYEQSLNEHGLKLVTSSDISEHVFLPFGEWLKGYIDQLKHSKIEGQKLSWTKYQGTASFLRWAYKKRVLSYRLIQITRVG